jgi:hypothetical protein
VFYRKAAGRQIVIFVDDLAPQVGFEPTTLRLTEAVPEIDQMMPKAAKMTGFNDLPGLPNPPSTSVDLDISRPITAT